MRRKQATALIDGIREILSAAQTHDELATAAIKIRRRLEINGLPMFAPCQGEAHSNAHIDHCSLCAPRWGFVGPVEVVS